MGANNSLSDWLTTSFVWDASTVTSLNGHIEDEISGGGRGGGEEVGVEVEVEEDVEEEVEEEEEG